MTKRIRFIALAVGLSVTAFTVPALAAMSSGDFGADDTMSNSQRLEQLEQKVQSLEVESQHLSAEQHQLLQLQSQLQELQHQYQQLQLNQQSLNYLEQRVFQLETEAQLHQQDHSSAIPSQLQSSQLTSQEKQDFNHAYGLLMNKDYDQAISAFNSFLNQYPKSSLKDDAHYWLGELYLVQGEPDKASQQFRIVITNPNNDKTPDAMLKLGNIFLAYGDEAHAKQMFQRLIKNYGNSDAADIAQLRLKSMGQ